MMVVVIVSPKKDIVCAREVRYVAAELHTDCWSLALSAIFASIPILALLFTLGVRRIAAWKAALTGMCLAILVALFVYHMPILTTFSAIAYGGAFGLFPICWIVYWAIVLYRISLESGRFEVIKHSIGSLTRDPHLRHC